MLWKCSTIRLPLSNIDELQSQISLFQQLPEKEKRERACWSVRRRRTVFVWFGIICSCTPEAGGISLFFFLLFRGGRQPLSQWPGSWIHCRASRRWSKDRLKHNSLWMRRRVYVCAFVRVYFHSVSLVLRGKPFHVTCLQISSCINCTYCTCVKLKQFDKFSW